MRFEVLNAQSGRNRPELPSVPPQRGDAPVEASAVEFSIVIPCLNEKETVASCVRKAQRALRDCGVTGEVIVADNGSTDGSVAIAEACGARVVRVEERGYGNALMAGFDVSRGQYLLMGDADDSYDFSDIRPFVEKMREGYDVVMGNRYRGGIRPGAMPWHHRAIGNPVLTGVLNLFFGSPIGDAHCGMRALTREAYRSMDLRTTGMEFASEMVVKACLAKLRICEVPVAYWPDGRAHRAHLRSFRDGWRHLRFLLLYSPRWLFAVPGLALLSVGLVINMVLFLGPVYVWRVVFDVHMMVLGAILALLGYQILCVGVFAKVFAVSESLLPPDATFERVFKHFTLERGMIVGALVLTAGLALLGSLVWHWYRLRFGPLELDQTLRPAISGLVLAVLGVQTVFASLFLSVLGLKRK